MNDEFPRGGIRVLRRKTTADRCDVHMTTVMRWANDPRFAHLGFPKPVQLADGSVGFFEHEVDTWLTSRPRVGVSDRAA